MYTWAQATAGLLQALAVTSARTGQGKHTAAGKSSPGLEHPALLSSGISEVKIHSFLYP